MRPILISFLALMLLPGLAAAQTLEKIKQSGELIIGFRTDAAPLSYLGDDQPRGYTPALCIALAPEIARAAGLQNMDVVLEPVTTENRFEKVANGDIDLLCGAASITLERRERVSFSIPIYVDGTTVALKKGGPSSFEELAGKKIGVRSGTTTLDALNNSLVAAGVEAEVIQFDDHPSGMDALAGDAVSAYFADQAILMNMVMNSEKAEDFKVLERILTVEKQGLALRRGDEDFRLAVDRGLSMLFQGGAVREIFNESIPGAQTGLGLEAMFLLSPTMP